MNTTEINNTVCDSKEESIRRALESCCVLELENKPISRPDISFSKVFFSFLLWLVSYLATIFVIGFIGNRFGVPFSILMGASVILLFALICLKAKTLVVNFVLLYQKYAPEKLRRSCLFTPSCSEYMLLAIEKYGFIRGFLKGCGRLGRCHHPNGGEDFP